MPWFKIDDEWHDHPKVRKAGNAAAGLWARCGAHCAQYLTDGFVEDDIANRYGTRKEIARLVEVALWAKVEGGYQMPDYLDYNPSAAQVKRDRAAAAQRQRRKRTGQDDDSHGVSHGVTGGVSHGGSHAHPDPTQPNPTEQVLNKSTPENTGEGGDNSKRSDVIEAFARMELDTAKAKGTSIRTESGFLEHKRKDARANPDLDRWLAERPSAPASAVAAWLTGETHSMQYYPPEPLAEVHYLRSETA